MKPPAADTRPLSCGIATFIIKVESGKGSVGWESSVWAMASQRPEIDVDHLAFLLALDIAAGALGPDWSAQAYPTPYALAVPGSRIPDPFHVGALQSSWVTLIPAGPRAQAMHHRHPEHKADLDACLRALAAVHAAGERATLLASSFGAQLALSYEDMLPHSLATIVDDANLTRKAIAEAEKLSIASFLPTMPSSSAQAMRL